MIILKSNSSIRLLSKKIITKSSLLNLKHNDSKNSSHISFNVKENLQKSKENFKQTKSVANVIENSNSQTAFFKNPQPPKKTLDKSFKSFSNESLLNLLKSLKESTSVDSFETIDEEFLVRRNRARNSIYFKFESNSKKNLVNLLNDCKAIGAQTNQIFFLEDSCLIEFSSQECVNLLIREQVKHMGNTLSNKNRTICYVSKSKHESLSQTDQNFLSQFNIKESSFNNSQSSNEYEILKSDKKFSDQIRDFYNKNKLDECNSAIRFFIASLIEDPLKNIFSECACLPFGSSMNKLGTKSADLDMTLMVSYQNCEFLKNENGSFLSEQSKQLNGDFFFINKKLSLTDNGINLKHTRLFNLIEYLISNVIAKFETKAIISGAKVPIIKFDFIEKPRINCDLSIKESQVAFKMTKLFWIYVKLDERVPLLAFLVRYWANLLNISSGIRPSPNFTNFQLTMLVFCFLLKHENPLVIPIEDIIESHDKNLNVRNLSISEFKKLSKYRNNLEVDELFEAFLIYYSKFNFSKQIISLSKIQKENEWSCIFIENPFIPEHNTAKNVNQLQVERFKYCCNITLNTIDAIKEKNEINFIKLINKVQQVNAKYTKSYR
jgi:hypothetical protein